jgi:hypothetical protein
MANNIELEILKLENQKLKEQLKAESSVISKEDLIRLLEVASKMRDVLLKCRGQQIDYRVARMIDDVLSEAAEMD